ncbi:MAG: SoxR reducing system RseC family protein [Clostridia bacterium]|nr:SoxR reducing system RseC family protein [Clostridia bacterium]
MYQKGIIKKTVKNIADVEIQRSTACGESCASCGLCPGQTAVVKADNAIGAKSGDTVIIDMADQKVLGAAFLVYIVPVVVLIIGYFIGYAIFKTEIYGAVTGFILMAVTFVIIMMFDKRLKNKYTPRIVSIEGNNDVGI